MNISFKQTVLCVMALVVLSSQSLTGKWSLWADTRNTIQPSLNQMRTYYVDANHPNASDSNPGTSELPWETIQHAVETVGQGDTILVLTGTYDGARIENSGTSDSPIHLFVAAGASVVLNNPGPENQHDSILEIESWEGGGVVAHWIIRGFEITNSPRYGIDIRNTNNISVKDNHVHNSISTGIFTAFSDDVLIEDNECHNNGEHGIYHSNSGDRPVVRRNILYYNTGCGIHMNGDISMGGDGIISDGLVEANIIYENSTNGGSGINMDGITNTIIRNNLVYDNHASGISLYQIDGGVCSSNNRVLHNTIVMPDDGRWALNIANTGCVGNQVFNNVFFNHHSWRGSILIAEPHPADFDSDYNVVVDRFSTDGGDNVIDLASWQVLGYDTHSLIATPDQLFSNPTENDYHHLAGSPAIDAGTTLPDVPVDIEGNLRPQGADHDIGAYEMEQTTNIYYVSTTGSDANNGSSPETAWQTLQHAADSVIPGDSVYVLAGTHAGATFNVSGTLNAPISFQGESRETAIIQDGLEFAKDVAYLNVAGFSVQDFSVWGVFVRGGNHHIHLNDLHITGGEAGVHLTWGYQAEDPIDGPVSNIILENSLIEDCLYTAVDGTPGPCDNLIFRNLEVTGAGIVGEDSWSSDGIAIERGDNITVEDCYIYDNGGDGIDLNSRDFDGHSTGIIVRRNRLVRNHMTGIKAWGGGRIENNVLWGQGFTPVFIGAFPGTYEVINNTLAYNMWSEEFGTRNYAFTAAYPNDETGISAEIDLTLLNNIFAFNCNDVMGGPTGLYLGEGVTLVDEGHNLYWSRSDGEIQAEFVQGEIWFTREDIANGTWTAATGQGQGNVTEDPLLVAGWPNADLHLTSASPAIDAGVTIADLSTDAEGNSRPSGAAYDIGAYEYQSQGWQYNFPQEGWYMISLSVIPADCTVSTLFPTALGETAYYWNSDLEDYVSVVKIEPKLGYWIAIPEATTCTINGTPLHSYIEHFSSAGWYMIGAVYESVDYTDPDDQPDGSVITPAFTYSTNVGDYVPANTLDPGQGYWTALIQECDLSVGVQSDQLAKIKRPLNDSAMQAFYDQFGSAPPPPPRMNWKIQELVVPPVRYALHQNYPNPFNPTTMIEFDLPEDQFVEIAIFNLRGERLINLLEKQMAAGSYTITWNGCDSNGQRVSSGLYLYRMIAGNYMSTNKLIIIR